MTDEYTQSRIARFTNELDSMTANMETMEYYGTAGDVFAAVSGKREILRVEVDPASTADEDTIRRWTDQAIAMALEEAEEADKYCWAFISEDLALGC